jgi:hypothetical protein
VTHDNRLLLKGPDHPGDMLGDLPERLSGEHLGMRPRFLDVSGSSGHDGVSAA